MLGGSYVLDVAPEIAVPGLPALPGFVAFVVEYH